jgi:hypothetical protein
MNIAQQILSRSRRRWAVSLICALLALSLTLPNTLAAGPLTGTFISRTTDPIDQLRGQFIHFVRPGETNLFRDWAGVLRLQLDKNTPGDGLGPIVFVFCIQLFVVVSHGNIYISSGPVTNLPNGKYIRYLLAKYPANGVAAGDPAEGAARQLAIWSFSDNLDLNTIQEPLIKARAIAIATDVRTYVDTNGPPPTNSGPATVTITPPTATLPQGQPATFTVTVAPPTAATTIDISVDGTALLDNGQQRATLPLSQGAATFHVTNPNAGTANVTAVLTYLIDAGTVFDPRGGRQTQRLVLGDGISQSATATVQTFTQPATPTYTPAGATNTPTSPAGGPTNTPTSPAGGPTNTPTSPAGGPTDTPIATNTPVKTPRPKTPAPAPDTPTPIATAPGTPGGSNETPGIPSGGSNETPGIPNGTPGGPGDTSGTAGVPAGGTGDTTGGNLSAQAPGGSVRPSSLPRTAGAAGDIRPALLTFAAILLGGGLFLLRRSARR